MIKDPRISLRHSFEGGLNLTPLVDIVFQLIVFFLVVSQVVTGEPESMALPQPRHSEARLRAGANRMVITLFSDAEGKISRIKVNAQVISNLPALVDLVLRQGPDLQARQGGVILRADRNLKFEHVEAVLRALSNASIGGLEIAVEQERSSRPAAEAGS